jgi:hypothetical protein
MSGESLRDLASGHALKPLPAGWRALYGIRSTRRHLASVDHVVVGPAGVFVVVAADGQLDATLTRAADAAIALAELIPLDPRKVHAVVCVDVVREVPAWAYDVVVCAADQLVAVISQRERALDPRLVDLVFARLREALPSGAVSSGRSVRPTAPRKTRVERRHERKTAPKHLPWTPGQQVSPEVRMALTCIASCLIICPIIGLVVWPVVGWFIAMVTSLM